MSPVKRKIRELLIGSGAALFVLVGSIMPAIPAMANGYSTPVDLGAASTFAVLAGAGISNTGTTTITGDVGTYPTASESGFTGADSVTITNGTNHLDDTAAGNAQTALAVAFADASTRLGATTVTGDTLGTLNLGPGIYSGGALSLTGTLTLTGSATDVWIFQADSTLGTAGSSQILLSGGAKAANVYWAVGSSATLGASSTFKGSILAYASITLYGSVTLEGRALAHTAAVTLNADNITVPTYTLTYTAGAHGSITGTSPQSVVSGSNGMAVTAVPDIG